MPRRRWTKGRYRNKFCSGQGLRISQRNLTHRGKTAKTVSWRRILEAVPSRLQILSSLAGEKRKEGLYVRAVGEEGKGR